MAPFSAPRPCRKYGCPAVTHDGYCPEHKRTDIKKWIDWSEQNNKQRPSAADRGYGNKWQEARAAYLKKYLWCVECRKQNRYTIATVIQHTTPHRGDMKIFWDKSRWAAYCTECHNKATHREIGERKRRAV